MTAASRALTACAVVFIGCIAPGAQAAEGFALYGEPKYGAGFDHFDYADPAAPKRGTLTLANQFEAGTFDKLDPFSLKGKAPPGVFELVFDTLAVFSFDEPATQYGLLADDIDVARDLRSVTFRLRPEARFSNGDPVTAEDVRYSFQTLTAERATPKYRLYFSEIDRVEVLRPNLVKFHFKRASRELVQVAGALPVFSPKWAAAQKAATTDAAMVPPIASGPYLVESADPLRGSIAFRRNPDYWASSLPVRRGLYNFDRVLYKFYRDYDLQVEAFKAGEFDVIVEGKARNWCCVYSGGKFASGELAKRIFTHQNVPGMNGYIFNLRRKEFQDVRVRHALSLVLDFDWINKNIFYGEYLYPYSYFSNSPLAAHGLPSEGEQRLLEPFRQELDPAVFGPMVPRPDEEPHRTLRENLILGQQLLAEAGWKYRDGALRNAAGEPFVLEASMSEGIPLPRIETYLRNLSRYGIVIKRKVNDAVTTRRKLAEFDFDMTMIAFRESRVPGSDMLRKLSSAEADVEGSENLIGLKSAAVDALIEALSNATTPEQLQDAAHALDRVLMHGYYVVPERYSFEHRVAFNTRLGFPATTPTYYTPFEWVLAAWWTK
ncbi:MAG: extracellular solute-binding protein [Gammaproteobacteria bacterium]